MREWTYPGMLLQSPALESASADNPGVGTKRDAEAESLSAAGVQHGREEGVLPQGDMPPRGSDSGPAPERGVTPAPLVKTGCVVFVVDRHGNPLDPTTPGRARELKKAGRSRVYRMSPFTIQVLDRAVEDSVVHPLVLGVDPGSRHTGLALARQSEDVNPSTGEVTTSREGVFLARVDHRGEQIHEKLLLRAQLRRGRRSRNLRYRAPRFDNRHPAKCESCGGNAQHGRRYCCPCATLPVSLRGAGSRGARRLPPSVQHRVDTTLTWVRRLSHLAPVGRVVVERVRFDMQAVQDPTVTGVGYQQGTLYGTEIREYVLARDHHHCVYCGKSGVGPGSVPLNLDHVHPKSRGGSDRASNLVASCIPCNQAKDNQWVEDYPKDRPDVLARVNRHRKQPLKDAAAVNTTRYAIVDAIRALGLPVDTSSGGRTKYNRTQSGAPKDHCLDALCVGDVDHVTAYPATQAVWRATGRGKHRRTNVDRYGFPRAYLSRTKVHHGFMTGDHVKAIVPTGKHAGTYVGRVAVRASGTMTVVTNTGRRIDGTTYKNLRLIQHADGYQHTTEKVSA